MVNEQRNSEEPSPTPTNECLTQVPSSHKKESTLSITDAPNLSSCVSAPPSTISAIAMLAEQKIIDEEESEGHQAIPAAVMTPFSEDMRNSRYGDHSWLRQRRKSRPSLSNLGVDKSLPGDLASPRVESGMPPGHHFFGLLGPRSTDNAQHIPRPSVRQNALAEKWEPSENVDDFHSSDDDDDNLDVLSGAESGFEWLSDDEESMLPEKKPRWKRKSLYIWTGITIVQLVLVAAGVLHLTIAPYSLRVSFQVWRLCFFFALLPYCWILGTFFTWLVIKSVEKLLFTHPNALYFTYAVRKHLKWVLRSVCVLVLWALMMLVETGDQNASINSVYDIILKILACISLFLCANLLKRLIAKLMALKFTNANQKQKMERALKKEQILKSLMRPRPRQQQEDDQVEGALPSFLNFIKKQQELQTMRNATVSDTTGTRPPHLMDMKKKAVSFSVAQNFTSESGNEVMHFDKDRAEALPAVKIQIEEESPQKSYHEDAHLSPNKASKSRKIFQMLSSKDDSDDESIKSDTATKTTKREKKQDPVKRARHLDRLNKLEKYIRKNAITLTFRDELNKTASSTFTDDRTVKRVATYVFWHIKPTIESPYVVKEDLTPFIKDSDLDLAFSMLDVDGDGKINLKDCVASVERIYHERCNLASTLRDTKSITKVLELLIGIIIHTVFFFFYLFVFQVNVGQVWVALSAFLVGFSFIFGSTVANVFENVIFLFGVHPYDIGDTLLINDQYLTVDEITINFTCCVSGYNLKVWFPNQQLQTNLFVNLTSSGTKWDVVTVYVDMDTDPIILKKIEDACREVRQKNSSEYGPGYRVKFGAADNPFKVGIQMVYEYSHQGIDFSRTATARSWMYETMARVLTENEINYTWPSLKSETGMNSSAPRTTVDSSRGGRSTLSNMPNIL